MKRLILSFVLLLALAGCFLFPSFPDNDPLTSGLSSLYASFQIVGADRDAQGLIVIKWVITDPDTSVDGGPATAIAYGIAYLTARDYHGMKPVEVTEYAFRVAVLCINSPLEDKPCKIQGSEPAPQ
jgi:hypothetical protein